MFKLFEGEELLFQTDSWFLVFNMLADIHEGGGSAYILENDYQRISML